MPPDTIVLLLLMGLAAMLGASVGLRELIRARRLVQENSRLRQLLASRKPCLCQAEQTPQMPESTDLLAQQPPTERTRS